MGMSAIGGAVLALTVPGCEPTGCVDLDQDGFGSLCVGGPDCDDTNPERNVDCIGVPAPDCDASPAQPGCPCLPEQIGTCYRGPAGTRAVGICRSGLVRCLEGHFGLCDGEVLPDAFELCDLEDGDCDGRVDERVTSPCGECDASCTGGVWGSAEAPFEAEAPLALTEDGSLTLALRDVVTSTLWVPNTADGTLSRIDAGEARETARYFTADPLAAAAEPTRVAVDWSGDVWVANRAFGGQGSVTKIAGTLERCVDRDDDGVIATSSGPGDILPFGSDECVLLHVPVGSPAGAGADGSVPRALAIDGDRGLDGASGGNAWVGLYGEQAVVELDGITGAVRRRVELGDVSPYMAAFDSRGTLWLASQRGVLARVDPSLEPPDVTRIELDADCYETYSLAIDASDRLFLTGFGCDRLWLYEPWRGVFTQTSLPASPRGVSLDGSSLWIAHTGGQATEVTLDPLAVRRTIDLDTGMLTPRETIGAATDSLGHAWMISETGGSSGGGIASRIDVATGVVDAHVEVGRAPHPQGDLTGWQRVGVREPEGTARHVFEGCGEFPTNWLRLHVHGQLSGGSIVIRARRAESVSALAGAAWRDVATLPPSASPIDLELEDGGVVEVELTLRTSSHRSAPVLELLGLEWDCGGPG